MSHIKIDKVDIIWSYIGNLLKLSINIILLPIIVRYLSEEDLGMWYVFASIGQIAILLDFGFAPALARNITYVWCGATKLQKENVIARKRVDTDWHYFKLVLLTCKIIYSILAVISLLVLLILGVPYILSLSNNDHYIISWILYSCGVFLNLLYSYYSSFLLGIGAIAEYNKASTISKFVQLVISYVLLIYGMGLMGIAFAYMLSGVIYRVLSQFYFYKYDNIRSHIINIHIENKYRKVYDLYRTIWYNASKDGIVMISNYLSTQANTLICSSVLGLASTGMYGLTMQIATVVTTISVIPFSTYHSEMQEKAVAGDKLASAFIYARSTIMFISVFLFLFFVVYLLLPIIPYLKPTIEINHQLFVAVIIYMLIYQVYHLAASYISTYNIIPYTKSFIITSVLSVIISYIVAKTTNCGIWSIVISPLVMTLAFNAWYWPFYSLRIVNIDKYEFLKIGIKETLFFCKNIIHK